jgi:N-hydroxyarylamine O-acetyltransferase
MWIDDYLARLEYDGPREPSADLLRELHVRHLLTIPFENLDIHWQRPIVVDVDRFLHKILIERRGGFCYELNGAFAALLGALGFDVKLLSARVMTASGGLGPDFDHMTLLVDGEWIADVGFGDSSLVPLRIDGTPDGKYRVLDGRYQSLHGEEWRTEYVFTTQPRELHEFGPMCHHQQTSPDSHFTKKKVITLARRDGRITLTSDKLIETRDGVKVETPVEDWEKALRENFGVTPVSS